MALRNAASASLSSSLGGLRGGCGDGGVGFVAVIDFGGDAGPVVARGEDVAVRYRDGAEVDTGAGAWDEEVDVAGAFDGNGGGFRDGIEGDGASWDHGDAEVGGDVVAADFADDEGVAADAGDGDAELGEGELEVGKFRRGGLVVFELHLDGFHGRVVDVENGKEALGVVDEIAGEFDSVGHSGRRDGVRLRVGG